MVSSPWSMLATGMATLDMQEESRKQEVVADRLLLTNIASGAEVRVLEARPRAINQAGVRKSDTYICGLRWACNPMF